MLKPNYLKAKFRAAIDAIESCVKLVLSDYYTEKDALQAFDYYLLGLLENFDTLDTSERSDMVLLALMSLLKGFPLLPNNSYAKDYIKKISSKGERGPLTCANIEALISDTLDGADVEIYATNPKEIEAEVEVESATSFSYAISATHGFIDAILPATVTLKQIGIFLAGRGDYSMYFPCEDSTTQYTYGKIINHDTTDIILDRFDPDSETLNEKLLAGIYEGHTFTRVLSEYSSQICALGVRGSQTSQYTTKFGIILSPSYQTQYTVPYIEFLNTYAGTKRKEEFEKKINRYGLMLYRNGNSNMYFLTYRDDVTPEALAEYKARLKLDCGVLNSAIDDIDTPTYFSINGTEVTGSTLSWYCNTGAADYCLRDCLNVSMESYPLSSAVSLLGIKFTLKSGYTRFQVTSNWKNGGTSAIINDFLYFMYSPFSLTF